MFDFFVFAFIVVGPDFIAGQSIEAVNPLYLFWSRQAICDVNPSAGYGWTAVAVGDFGLPSDFEAWSIEFINNTLLGQIPSRLGPRH